MPRRSRRRLPVRAVLAQQSRFGGRRASPQPLTAQTSLAEVLQETPQKQSQRQGCGVRSVWGHIRKDHWGQGEACGAGHGQAQEPSRPAPGKGAKPECAYLGLAR